MEAILEAQARDTFGKNEARRTRRGGQVPAVLYGARDGDGKATPIAVRPKALLKILHSESGANTLISLKLAGAGDTRVLVKDYQLDPITHEVLHADFYRVAMDKMLRVTIPIVVQRRAEGREAAGRHPRVHPPRDRNRVPAGRHSRAHRRRRQRADAAPGRPRARHRGRTRSGSRSATPT